MENSPIPPSPWPIIALWLLCALAVLVLGYKHYQLISIPTPLDLYEGLMPLITGLIAQGHNPYTYEYQPYYTNSYPPLYNLLVVPLTAVFANSYELHRSVSAVLLIVACALCYLAVMREQARQDGWLRVQAASAALLLYAALLFYSTPIASTNALGVLLMMLSVVLPWWRGFDTAGLLLSLLFGVLAFFAKQYFAGPMAFVALYVFVFVSKLRGSLFAFSYAVLLLLTLTAVHHSSPYFLDNTLWGAMAASAGIRHFGTLLRQLETFALVYSGVIAALMVYWGVQLRHHQNRQSEPTRQPLWNIHQPGAPLLSKQADYYWWVFSGASLLIIGSLGWHPANFMSYLFQLMSPFFLIAAFRSLSRLNTARFILVPCLAASLYFTWDMLQKDFSVDQDEWAKAERLIIEHDNILASQILLMPLMQHDKKINQSGHTFYFRLAKEKPGYFEHDKPQHRVAAVWDNYMADIYRQVESQAFDLVMLHKWDIDGVFHDPPPHKPGVSGPEYFKRFYRLEQRLRLSLTERPGGNLKVIGVWVPRK